MKLFLSLIVLMILLQISVNSVLGGRANPNKFEEKKEQIIDFPSSELDKKQDEKPDNTTNIQEGDTNCISRIMNIIERYQALLGVIILASVTVWLHLPTRKKSQMDLQKIKSIKRPKRPPRLSDREHYDEKTCQPTIGGSKNKSRLVGSIHEIQVNLKTLDKLLDSPCRPEHLKTYKEKIIKRARHYIKYKNSMGKVAFAPSRFAGYKDYSMEQYSTNENANESSKAVSLVFGKNPREDENMEFEFIRFCDENEFESIRMKKKFWDFTQLLN